MVSNPCKTDLSAALDNLTLTQVERGAHGFVGAADGVNSLRRKLNSDGDRRRFTAFDVCSTPCWGDRCRPRGRRRRRAALRGMQARWGKTGGINRGCVTEDTSVNTCYALRLPDLTTWTLLVDRFVCCGSGCCCLYVSGSGWTGAATSNDTPWGFNGSVLKGVSWLRSCWNGARRVLIKCTLLVNGDCAPAYVLPEQFVEYLFKGALFGSFVTN